VVKRSSGAFLRKLSRSTNSLDGSGNVRRKTVTIDSLAGVQHDDAEEKAMAEEAKWRMPADFFYESDDPSLVPSLRDNELPKSVSRPSRFLGFDFHRHYNIVWTSETEFAYMTGHVVCLLNISTDERRFLHGRDNGGIGSVGMSPDFQYMAVAEKSVTTAPNIYIYEYEGLRLYRILRKGTEKGYASVKFSPHNKSHLAALGMFPDYLLSVWDWRNERLLLKCKAYGQDVFNVAWGNYPGQMTTCGTGHIRFWKMATTFTGLNCRAILASLEGQSFLMSLAFWSFQMGRW
jgi:WD40 repeat protein